MCLKDIIKYKSKFNDAMRLLIKKYIEKLVNTISYN